MDLALVNQVWQRAGGRCEYCRRFHLFTDLPFEIDHIIARKHGGLTLLINLALSCFWCNRYKGSDFSSLDPKTKKRLSLFNPRRHKWSRHFRWDGARLLGRTPIGRATVFLLRINHPLAIRHRMGLMEEGLFPPSA